MDTLYGKTFFILSVQLGLTWLATVTLLRIFRTCYYSKANWISGGENRDGSLDLFPDWEIVAPYAGMLFIVHIASFIILCLYGLSDIRIGMPLFCLCSVLTGIELALCLVPIDENLGSRILALTAIVTCIAGLIGARSGVDFSFLRDGLHFSLGVLLFYGFVRIFFSIPGLMQRLFALFGAVVFSGYLLYDFQRLSRLNRHAGSNTWSTAMESSISIYLDIVNLFLSLLKLIVGSAD